MEWKRWCNFYIGQAQTNNWTWSIPDKPVYGKYSCLPKPVPKYLKLHQDALLSRTEYLCSKSKSKHLQTLLPMLVQCSKTNQPWVVSCKGKKEAMLSCKLVTLPACLSVILLPSTPPSPFPISCSPHPSVGCIDLVCRHVGELKGGKGNSRC